LIHYHKVPGQVKVKAKVSLCLTKYRATTGCWGSGGIAPRILKYQNKEK